MTKINLSPRVLGAGAAALVLLVALIGWFAVVSPQRSKADKLDTQIAEQQTSLASAEALIKQTKAAQRKQQKALKALEVALPQTLQMPSLLRQVQALAAGSGVTLNSFTPSTALATTAFGYEAVPIQLAVTGRYAAIQKFMHDLRLHAGKSKGRVNAKGRLFSVDSLGLTPGGVTPGASDAKASALVLSATIAMNAFVYSGVPAPVAVSTTETSTTETSDNSASAAGVTP